LRLVSYYEVKQGTTARLGRVEGELKVGRNATIRAETGRKVVVTEGAYLEGPATIDCDFECKTMRVEGRGYGPAGDVTINGDLTVHERADIDASVRVKGAILAGDLDIGGHMNSGPLTTRRLRVGGHLKMVGRLEADEVDVGGHMTVPAEVKIRNLRVGGHTTVEGGAITGDIRVRGRFTTTKKLSFGRLEVFGNTSFPAGCSGERLSAIGTVVFDGDASCKELEVTGTARVKGDLTTDNVEVKGKLEVSGRIRASQKIRAWGTVETNGDIQCDSLGVGGKLVADCVSAAERTDITGELRTLRGLKTKTVVVGRGSKVSGPIVAQQVDVGSDADLGSFWGLPWWRGNFGRTTTVEDIHGNEVRVWGNSRARCIFGETVVMEEGSMAEEVVYTKEVRLPVHKKYFLTKPPVKTEKLPDPF
jgi:cytoskeletal protein CcmA (bactofilin family)